MFWKENSEVSKNCKVWSKQTNAVAVDVDYTRVKYILCHVLEHFQIHCNYIISEADRKHFSQFLHFPGKKELQNLKVFSYRRSKHHAFILSANISNFSMAMLTFLPISTYLGA